MCITETDPRVPLNARIAAHLVTSDRPELTLATPITCSHSSIATNSLSWAKGVVSLTTPEFPADRLKDLLQLLPCLPTLQAGGDFDLAFRVGLEYRLLLHLIPVAEADGPDAVGQAVEGLVKEWIHYVTEPRPQHRCVCVGNAIASIQGVFLACATIVLCQ